MSAHVLSRMTKYIKRIEDCLILYRWIVLALVLFLCYAGVGINNSLSRILILAFCFFIYNLIFPSALTSNLKKELKVQKSREQKLLSFCQIYGAINSSLQLKKVLNLVVNNTYELTNSEFTLLALFDEERDLKIEPNSILVRDNGKVYANPQISNQVSRFAECAVKKNRPIFLDRADLEQEDALSGSKIESLICLPLFQKAKNIGVLVSINPSSEIDSNDIMLLDIMGNMASVAIENARLIEKSQNLMIQEERNRIARDMHDGLAQSLFSLILNLEVCKKLFDSKPELVKQKIVDLIKLAEHNLSGTRQYIYDLCPSELKRLGLSKALDVYTKEFTSVNGLRADFELAGSSKTLSEDIEKALYYITQEALSNARKHACAEYVCVQLEYTDRQVFLSIEDDGNGFDANEVLIRRDNKTGKGLSNINKRARTIGGECAVHSDQGKGTKIEVKIPLAEFMN